MNLYLAGNFPIMGNLQNEQELRDNLGADYHRLCAFFYEKEANVIMQLKEKEMNNEKKGAVKRSRKSKTGNSRKRNS